MTILNTQETLKEVIGVTRIVIVTKPDRYQEYADLSQDFEF